MPAMQMPMNPMSMMTSMMPMMGSMMPMPMMGGMMPMPMMGGMMPMMMIAKMTCEMTDTDMTCKVMPPEGMPMDMFKDCCQRMMTMMNSGMPCMMMCGNMMMMCMPATRS